MANQAARVGKLLIVPLLILLGTALVTDLLRQRGSDQPMLMVVGALVAGLVLGRGLRR
jgi:hypothetical protein